MSRSATHITRSDRRVIVVCLIAMLAGGALHAAAGSPARKMRCDPCSVEVFAQEDAWSFEHLLAANPNDPDHLVVADMEMSAEVHGGIRSDITVRVSKDGGRTWMMGELPRGHELDPTHPFFGARDFVDPFAAILDDGTVIVGGLATTYVWPTIQGTDVFIARSFDGGLTFPDVKIIAEGAGVFPGPARINDHPFIDVGEDGTIIVAWTFLDLLTAARIPPEQDGNNPEKNVVPVDFRFSLSRDGGQTWTAPGTAATGGYIDNIAPAATAVASDGTLLIAGVKREEHTSTPGQDPVGWGQWATGGDGQGHLALITSSDQGDTWTSEIVERIRPLSGMVAVHIARVGKEEHLFVGYNERTPDGIAPMLGVSPDLGKTWELIRLSGFPRGGPSGPSFAVDERGIAYIAHVDKREDRHDIVVVAASPRGVIAQITLETTPSYRGVSHYWGVAGLDRGAYVMWNSPSDAAGPSSLYFNPSGDDYDLRGAHVWLTGGPEFPEK